MVLEATNLQRLKLELVEGQTQVGLRPREERAMDLGMMLSVALHIQLDSRLSALEMEVPQQPSTKQILLGGVGASASQTEPNSHRDKTQLSS
jgi:hypothetical protein